MTAATANPGQKRFDRWASSYDRSFLQTLLFERIHDEVLVAMNELSLRKFGPTVASGGLILYNSTKLPEGFSAPQARVVCVPASETADTLGSAKVANVVMLGALLEETECLPTESAIAVLEETVKNPKLLELDRKAIAAGRDYVDTQVEVGAVSQPDGYSY